MRLLVQRVARASVSVAQEKRTVGKIGNGLFVLVGISKDDTKIQADFLAEKLVKLRIMADKQGKMNLNVKELKGEILVVSQFTLYANTSGGNRPSFIDAGRPKKAKSIYEHFVKKLRSLGAKVETGEFGSYMNIEVLLDGPVTIILEK